MSRVLRHIGRCVLASVASVGALLLLCLILIYLPPIQKFIIDKVLDSVSEDMESSVSVGDVCIAFPLDIHVEKVAMVRKADGLKMIELAEVEASVKLKPLLEGLISVDSILLNDLKAETDTLIPAAAIIGDVGVIKVLGVDFNLESGHLSVGKAALCDADLNVLMNDSVPKDSTEDEEPVLKSIDVATFQLNNIACALTLPSDSDTISLGGRIGQGVLSAKIDMERETYLITGLDIDALSGHFCGQDMKATIQDCNLNLPKLTFQNKLIRAKVLTATINHDFCVDVKDACFNLEDGGMSANALVRCDNLNSVADILPAEMLNGISIPAGSMLKAELKLRDKNVEVDAMELAVPEVADLQLKDMKFNMNDLSFSASVAARVEDGQQLMAMMPNDIGRTFMLPDGMTMMADVVMADDAFSVKNAQIVAQNGAKLRVDKAHYDLRDESYDVDMDVDKLYISQFVKLPEQTYISGHLCAKGQGFDFLSDKTYTDAKLHVDSMAYGRQNITDVDAMVNLNGSALISDVNVADKRLQGRITYDGLMTHRKLDGRLNLDVGVADLYALNLSTTPLNLSTASFVTLSTDMKESLQVDAGVLGLNVNLGNESVLIDEFVFYLDASEKQTSLSMYSGDMDMEVRSPLNYKELSKGYTNVADVVITQLKSMQIDASKWKECMPEANVSAHIGEVNPIADLLGTFNVWFSEAIINVETSPEVGLECKADIQNLQVSEFLTDSVNVEINEDSATLNYSFTAKIPEQTGLKAFTATLGGHLKDKELQTRMHYYDEKGEEGIDFGLRAQVADSMLCMDVYPFNPVLGYRQFEVSDTNYINFHKKNRVFADVQMKSLVDSCEVDIMAEPRADQLQDIHLMIQNLDLTPLVAVMPFMPSIRGLVKGDLSYVQGLDTTFSIGGDIHVDNLIYEGAKIGDMGTALKYNPMTGGGHQIDGLISRNGEDVMHLSGKYDGELDANVRLDSLPLDIVSALAPEMPVALEGKIGGEMTAKGTTDNLHLNGFITPVNTRFSSRAYSLNIGIENDTIFVNDSKINFDRLRITSAGENPITMRGDIDLSDITNPYLNISLSGENIELVNAPKTKNAELYGKVNGNLQVRAKGTTSALNVSGQVTLLNTSDVTYIMTNTALSMGYRLDDIVTFVDFSMPPDTTVKVSRNFFGLDMNLALNVEEGARMKCIFSADGKSLIDVTGGGSLSMVHAPEGVTQLTGRYTIDKGEMRYSNTVIPLKTFKIADGSFIEFTGDPMNPKLSLAATERVRTTVSNSDKSSRMVTFNTGLRLSKTLKNLGLDFTIDAPEDVNVQQELAGMTAEEKNKLALSMMATGMYVSSSNSSAFSTTNALNNFLQGEINNLAGKALSSTLKMDMNLGMEQTTGQDGDTHTDYSFRFTKRFFSDRLNIVVGGMINTSGNQTGNAKAGTYINDVSMEWRLDRSGTQYVRLFHDTDYNNLIEGVLTENGGGIVLRKKVNDWKDLWKLFQIKK